MIHYKAAITSSLAESMNTKAKDIDLYSNTCISHRTMTTSCIIQGLNLLPIASGIKAPMHHIKQ